MINVHEDILKHMGEEVGSVFYRLLSEYQTIRDIWSEYELLFWEKRPGVAILKSAPFFFGCVQDSFLRVVCMGICRLTDEPKGGPRGKYEHITIQLLPKIIMKKELKSFDEKELECKKEEIAKKIQPLKSLIKIAIEKANFAKELRDKSFAHTDFQSVINKVGEPESGSIPKMRRGLDAIAEVLRAVQRHYGVKIKHVDHMIHHHGPAFTLIEILKLGLKAEQAGYYIDIDGNLKNNGE